MRVSIVVYDTAYSADRFSLGLIFSNHFIGQTAAATKPFSLPAALQLLQNIYACSDVISGSTPGCCAAILASRDPVSARAMPACVDDR